jgi:hypothetical protein
LFVQVKDRGVMAEDAFSAKTRARQAAMIAGWRELVAARREAMVRAAILRNTVAARNAIAGWQCYVQVGNVGRAGGIEGRYTQTGSTPS